MTAETDPNTVEHNTPLEEQDVRQDQQQLEPEIQPEPQPEPKTQVEVQAISVFEAGIRAARQLMRAKGRPEAVDWFLATAPDASDPSSIAASGRPMEFWAGLHAELKSVAGTA